MSISNFSQSNINNTRFAKTIGVFVSVAVLIFVFISSVSVANAQIESAWDVYAPSSESAWNVYAPSSESAWNVYTPDTVYQADPLYVYYPNYVCSDCGLTPTYNYTPSYDYGSYVGSYSYSTPSYSYQTPSYNYTPSTYRYISQATTQSLGGSCTPSQSQVETGQSVTWNAYAYGGTSPYTYSWSGTEGLTGNGSFASIPYSNTGVKTAVVTITSANGQTVTVNCSGSVYVGNYNNNYYYGSYNYNNGYYYSGYNGYYNNYNNYSNIDATCYPDQTSVGINQPVRWYVSTYSGSNYYSYAWSGSDNLYARSQEVFKSYATPGIKYAYVRIMSGSVDQTITCTPVNVGNTGNVYLYGNQGNYAGLSSVYLNQVPYTGVGDSYKTIGFISLVTALSLAITYMVFKKQYRVNRRKAIEHFKASNMEGRG